MFRTLVMARLVGTVQSNLSLSTANPIFREWAPALSTAIVTFLLFTVGNHHFMITGYDCRKCEPIFPSICMRFYPYKDMRYSACIILYSVTWQDDGAIHLGCGCRRNDVYRGLMSCVVVAVSGPAALIFITKRVRATAVTCRFLVYSPIWKAVIWGRRPRDVEILHQPLYTPSSAP